jgi:hypothetical protein
MKQWGKQQSAAQTGSFLAPARAPADRVVLLDKQQLTDAAQPAYQ